MRRQEQATVETPGLSQMEMASRWDTVHDLMGGTNRMRELGQRHLPKGSNETPDDYQ